ncbi:hypothetical protein D9615_004453 [Tricholomella constricta]|uniref:Uncharacterized protein n=1 Tax=Tricholomella constricta TaxID=117010 RepID=A0A8H5HF86_9AGAR|nr:hypothetical protein D9615_004453 [Tricholomella constricta]
MFTSRLSARHWSSDSVTIVAGGASMTFNPYADGGGKPVAIKKGKAFAGRLQGGGTRSQIFGTRDYGSGYPMGVGRGVDGRWFPFYFWPVVWLGYSTDPGDTYLYATGEYGLPDNTTRPGGGLSTITYVSNAASSTTFRVLTDSATATFLSTSLTHCNPFLNLSSVSPEPYPASPPGGIPLPVQALQYYRASSVVLTLDGYNNTAAILPAGAASNTFLPGSTDTNLLTCLNSTIGRSVILVEKHQPLSDHAIFGIVAASVIVALLLVCAGCVVYEECRRRRDIARARPPAPLQVKNSIGVMAVARPPPAAVLPSPNTSRYKMSSSEWSDASISEDSASLIRNARSIDGALGDDQQQQQPQPGRPRQPPSPWWRWGRRNAQPAIESIELGSSKATGS